MIFTVSINKFGIAGCGNNLNLMIYCKLSLPLWWTFMVCLPLALYWFPAWPLCWSLVSLCFPLWSHPTNVITCKVPHCYWLEVVSHIQSICWQKNVKVYWGNSFRESSPSCDVRFLFYDDVRCMKGSVRRDQTVTSQRCESSFTLTVISSLLASTWSANRSPLDGSLLIFIPVVRVD